MPGAIKAKFANRARRFANCAQTLPGAAAILVGSVIGILFATLSGAFGTIALPLLERLAFWVVLIGCNSLLYLGWFAWQVRTPADWTRAVVLGMMLMTIPLPLEIGAAHRVATGRWPPLVPESWLYGLGMGGSLALLAAALRFFWPRPTPVAPAHKGELWRHGVRDADALAAISAEDHYCRLTWLDGSSKLVLARFNDLSAELADADGLVIRRGVWIAARAVAAVERDGRRLLVALPNGNRVAASASGRVAMKAANWH